MVINMKNFAHLPQAVEIENNNNTRHFGGYKAADIKTIIKRKLIRSGAPSGFSKKDIALLLNEYNLKCVVDLRTEYEISENPSLAEIPGVSYSVFPLSADIQQSLSFNGDTANVLVRLVKSAGGTAEAVAEAMKKTYTHIVTDEALIERTRKIFDILLDNADGCVLFHCAGGKDRTGVMSTLILSALGVGRDTIMQDYLDTNAYINAGAAKQLEELSAETKDSEITEGVKQFVFAHKAYLENVLTTVNGTYGSMDNYLEQALGLTASKIARLRATYTENRTLSSKGRE
jgi:protein-tyrosine phosphatase